MTLEKSVIDELKNKLLEEKSKISADLSLIGKRVGETDNFETSFDDLGDGEDENATEVEEYTDNLALSDSLEKQLREIDESLEKIENGSYGKCVNCGKDINIERLRAYPAAKTCLDCN